MSHGSPIRLRKLALALGLTLLLMATTAAADVTYPIVDTGQSQCFDNHVGINPPSAGEAFYGQDAQLDGIQPSYTVSGDGLTVYDNITGLTWTKSPDTDRDGDIDYDDKLLYSETQAYADQLNAEEFGGYNDWRLPSIKELYSLMNFDGTDPSGPDPVNLSPFIDTTYFDFAYGDESAGDRIIDAQFWSSNECLDDVFDGQEAAFGLNLADGRIKGYPTGAPGFVPRYVYYVRGNPDYGDNAFVDNGDGTISDTATGLMWTQNDHGGDGDGPRSGVLWEEALAYAQQMNDEAYLGYNDWRLPNAKELQSIVDYDRAPGATGSAALDPLFNPTQITNEEGEVDWPWYWSSTTHIKSNGMGDNGAYVCFGRGMGFMQNQWMDVHSAGCQRSDLKDGNFLGYNYNPDGYYFGNAPQGDASRAYNYVMLVRDVADAAVDDDPDQTAVPSTFEVAAAYPNPFNPTVTVQFSLAAGGEVTVSLINTLGQTVQTSRADYGAGQHRVELDASGNANGMYVVQLRYANQTVEQNVVLMK